MLKCTFLPADNDEIEDDDLNASEFLQAIENSNQELVNRFLHQQKITAEQILNTKNRQGLNILQIAIQKIQSFDASFHITICLVNKIASSGEIEYLKKNILTKIQEKETPISPQEKALNTLREHITVLQQSNLSSATTKKISHQEKKHKIRRMKLYPLQIVNEQLNTVNQQYKRCVKKNRRSFK